PEQARSEQPVGQAATPGRDVVEVDLPRTESIEGAFRKGRYWVITIQCASLKLFLAYVFQITSGRQMTLIEPIYTKTNRVEALFDFARKKSPKNWYEFLLNNLENSTGQNEFLSP